MKTVLVFGTFDNIHPGHEYFLRKAATHGDRLVTVVSGDSYVHERKRRHPIHIQNERISRLEASGLAARVVPADEKLGSYGVIMREKPDVICLGHDQNHLRHNLDHWLKKNGYPAEIITIPPWKREEFSSTLLNKPRYTRKMIGFYLIMILSMALWGLSWISAKIASREADPSLLVFWRVFTSLVIFIPLALIKKEKIFPGWRGFLWTAAAALCMAAYNQMFFRGLVKGMASSGGVIVTTLNPLFAFLLSLAFTGRKEKIGWLQIAGLSLGLAGGLLFVEPWKLTSGELLKSGNLFFLAGALLWAGLTVSGQQALKTTPLFSYNVLLYGMTTLFTLPLMFGKLVFTGYTTLFWIQILYMGILSGAFATTMYFMATRNIGAARAGAFTFMVPFSAVLFSWLILNEKPGWITLIGGIICLTAIYLVNAARKRGET
jgi:cytidyltransferase-like protein